MKQILTAYSLSVSFFTVFLILWILEYMTLDYSFWSSNFRWIKWFPLIFFGFSVTATHLIHKGSPRTIEAHSNTQKKLDKILSYLEIEK